MYLNNTVKCFSVSVIYRAQQIDIEEPTGSESQSLAYSLMSASSTQHVKSAFSIH